MCGALLDTFLHCAFFLFILCGFSRFAFPSPILFHTPALPHFHENNRQQKQWSPLG